MFKLCFKTRVTLRNYGDGLSSEKECFKKIIEAAPLAIFQAEMDGVCLYLNHAWEVQTGLTEALSLGKGWLSALHVQDADDLLRQVRESALSGMDQLKMNIRLLGADGGFSFHSLSVTVNRDATGNPVSFTGYLHPVPGAKTRDFHALISSLEDIVLEIDYHKVFRNAWARNDDDLFLPREQFLNKTVDEVFGESGATFTQVIDEVIQTGQPREFIYPGLYQFADRWYRAKVRPLSSEALAGEPALVVVIQEYTETRKYSEALEKAKRELEQGKRLLDTSEQLSLSSGWELDTATGRITMTRQAYHIYGLEEGTPMTLETFSRFYEPKDWEKVREAQVAAITSHRSFDIELKITARGGIRKWVRLIGVPIRSEEKVTAIVGAMMDVSGKKAIEKELIEAKTMAEHAAREKTDFLSVMSHEIRTPLNNIIGLSNLLKMEHLPGNEKYIENLIFSSNHLLQLINDILNLHKIEEGKFDHQLVNTDLDQLVGRIQNQFIPLALEKDILLNCDIDPAVPAEVMANPTLLTQILNNLISNAIKFTEAGSVTLRLTLIDQHDQEVHVRFSVADTGVGIPASKQDTIFERFRQLGASPGSKYPGTGLGLTITRKLIESEGSRIGLCSEPGKGTEFYFDLRFALPDQKQPAVPGPVTPVLETYKGKLSGITVLLVEDNPINILITTKHLEYFGITPDCATHGDEALDLLEHRTYQMLLLDLHIPGPDGYYLAGIIRERYPATRVIAYTADEISGDQVAMAALGITDVLTKPFLPEELLALLIEGRSPA